MDLDALRADPDFPGTEAARNEAWGLVGTTGEPGDGPLLILQGHVDVVPPGDPTQWHRDPFHPHVENGVMYGRGTCDMKAGLAANLAAAAALRSSGVSLGGGARLGLHCVQSEEDGGLGAFGTLRRGHTGDACIITEPTSGTLTTANAGALTFTITVSGRATHASTRYAGHSAIDAYLVIHRALAELEARRNAAVDPLMSEYPVPYCLSVGALQAGDWSSSVPDRLTAEGRLGVALGEHPADAQRDLEQAVADACAGDPWLADHPAEVTWTGGQFASGRLDGDHPLRHVVADAHSAVTGAPRIRERGAPYGSDLRLYAGAGIPTLHYGPGDVRLAHGPREAVPLADVLETTRVLVVAAMRAFA